MPEFEIVNEIPEDTKRRDWSGIRTALEAGNTVRIPKVNNRTAVQAAVSLRAGGLRVSVRTRGEFVYIRPE